jgi:hypothetical protein
MNFLGIESNELRGIIEEVLYDFKIENGLLTGA